MVTSKILETFGDRLMRAMSLKKIDQTGLAKKMKVSRPSIGKYVHNITQPNADKIKAIAECLEVSADYLVGLTGSTEKELHNRMVEEQTGLPKETVESFVEMKGASNGELNMFVFNEIMQLGVLEELINNLRECIQYRYYALLVKEGEEFLADKEDSGTFIDISVHDEIMDSKMTELNDYIEWTFTRFVILSYSKIMQHFESPTMFEHRKKMLIGKLADFDEELRKYFTAVLQDSRNIKDFKDKDLISQSAMLRNILGVDKK